MPVEETLTIPAVVEKIPPVKKAPARKAAARKTPARKAPARKAPAARKAATPRKTTARKTTARKTATTRRPRKPNARSVEVVFVGGPYSGFVYVNGARSAFRPAWAVTGSIPVENDLIVLTPYGDDFHSYPNGPQTAASLAALQGVLDGHRIISRGI